MAAVKAYIHKLNVVRFQTLLEREVDVVRRKKLMALLDAEFALLAQAERREAGEAATGREAPTDRPH